MDWIAFFRFFLESPYHYTVRDTAVVHESREWRPQPSAHSPFSAHHSPSSTYSYMQEFLTVFAQTHAACARWTNFIVDIICHLCCSCERCCSMWSINVASCPSFEWSDAFADIYVFSHSLLYFYMCFFGLRFFGVFTLLHAGSIVMWVELKIRPWNTPAEWRNQINIFAFNFLIKLSPYDFCQPKAFQCPARKDGPSDHKIDY